MSKSPPVQRPVASASVSVSKIAPAHRRASRATPDGGEVVDRDALLERGERLGHKVWELPRPPTEPPPDGPGAPIQRIQLRSSADVARDLAQDDDGEAVDADVEAEIDAARGAGAPLDPTVRRSMEQAFGQDFSAVRAHVDDRSAGLSERLNARAFTVGRDVFWGRDAPPPESSGGQELLAHELTHVVQQGASSQLESAGTVQRAEDDGPTIGGGADGLLQRAERLVSPANALELLQQALTAWAIPFGDFKARDLVLWDRGQAWQGRWLAIVAATGGRTYFQQVSPGFGQGDLYELDGNYVGTGDYDLEPVVGGWPAMGDQLDDLDGDDIELVPVGMDEDDETYQIEVRQEDEKQKPLLEIVLVEEGDTQMETAPSSGSLIRTPISKDVIMGGTGTPMAMAFQSLPGISGPRTVGDGFIARVEGARTHGEPLTTELQRRLGDHVGEDLAAVRVHADTTAARLSREAGARAFATGDDIFFGADEYRPETPRGQELVAHEVAHVAQARRGAPFFGATAQRASVGERSELAHRVRSTPSWGGDSVRRHPGYVGHGGGGPVGHAVGFLAGQGYLGTLGGAAGQHAAVVGGAVHQATDTLNWPGAGALAFGGHFNGQVKPAAGTVTHRASSRAIRNPNVTRKFANTAPVKAWIAAYVAKTGYAGNWNMHHWWPLAWDGDDVAANLTPLPTAAGGLGHQTHRQWHNLLRTGGGKMWPRTVSQHYKNV